MSLKLPHVAALAGLAAVAFVAGLLLPREPAPVAAPAPGAPEPAVIADEPVAQAPEAPASAPAPAEPEWASEPVTMGYADPFVEPAPESEPADGSGEPQRGTLSFVGDASWPEYPWPEPRLASLRAEEPSDAFVEPDGPPAGGRPPEARRPPPPRGGGHGPGGGSRGGAARGSGGGGGCQH